METAVRSAIQSAATPKESCPRFSIRNLGCLVARARRALRREFEARIAVYDLTVPQVAVLTSLWEQDGRTISELTRLVSSDGPTLTSLLDRLETKGLIHRERDPKDRRTVRIHLCERAQDLQEDLARAGQEVMAIVTRGMTPMQIDALMDLLELLCETIENPQ